jgi:hypothetical protein
MAAGTARSVTGAPSGFLEMMNLQARPLSLRGFRDQVDNVKNQHYCLLIANNNRQPLPGAKQFRRNQFSTSADFLFLLLFSKQLRHNQFST